MLGRGSCDVIGAVGAATHNLSLNHDNFRGWEPAPSISEKQEPFVSSAAQRGADATTICSDRMGEGTKGKDIFLFFKKTHFSIKK